MNKLLPIALLAASLLMLCFMWLDKAFGLEVEFSGSSQDWQGIASHTNLGLAVDRGPFLIDRPGLLLAPVSYFPVTGIGYGIPDQTAPVRVSVTLTDIQAFGPLVPGEAIDWKFQNHDSEVQWGTIVVTDTASLTVDNLLIMDNPLPAGLLFKRPPPAKVCASVVFTQQPRHTTPLEADQPNKADASDGSNWQHVPDIQRTKTTKTDLIWQRPDCQEVVIESFTDKDIIGAAGEAKVSPSGRYIAYSVATAPDTARKWNICAINVTCDTGLWEFEPEESRIKIYDTVTGEKWFVSEGYIDRFPEWYSEDESGDGILVFTSNRAGVYSRLSSSEPSNPDDSTGRNFYPLQMQQLYRARLVDKQLTDFRNIWPFPVMEPEVLSNGDVCFSEGNYEAPRWRKDYTPANRWGVSCISINGGDQHHPELNWHGSTPWTICDQVRDWYDPTSMGGECVDSIKGLRGFQQIGLDDEKIRVAVSNYYAQNSLGKLGSGFSYIYDGNYSEGFSRSENLEFAYRWTDPFAEGSGQYMPNMTPIVPWALSQDMGPRKHLDLRSAGRAGGFAAYPGPDNYLATRGRGHCFEAPATGTSTYEWHGGEPPCKKQINLATQLVVSNPFDGEQWECVAGCSMDVHAFDPQAVYPYRELFGIDAPATVQLKGDATVCSMNSVNARVGEHYPPPGFLDSPQARIDLMGNVDEDYKDVVTHIGVELFSHWPTQPNRVGVYSVDEVIKAEIFPDGSVTIPVPCNVPFQHFGYDAAGEKVASALAPLSLNGELFCKGCHEARSTERVREIGPEREAFELFKNTQAGAEND